MKHEEKGNQLVAMWYHVGFAALYVIAALWHLRGANEHREAANARRG